MLGRAQLIQDKVVDARFRRGETEAYLTAYPFSNCRTHTQHIERSRRNDESARVEACECARRQHRPLPEGGPFWSVSASACDKGGGVDSERLNALAKVVKDMIDLMKENAHHQAKL
jgi:hypothetical protein